MIKLNKSTYNGDICIYNYIPRKEIINTGKYSIDTTIWITFGIFITKNNKII